MPHVLRLVSRPRRGFAALRAASTRNVSQKLKPEPNIRRLEDIVEPIDHRKPWFFTAQKISNWAVIPSVLLYAVFFFDFGDKEHVFSPARRWLDRQKATFLSLTPEERELVKTQSDPDAKRSETPS